MPTVSPGRNLGGLIIPPPSERVFQVHNWLEPFNESIPSGAAVRLPRERKKYIINCWEAQEGWRCHERQTKSALLASRVSEVEIDDAIHSLLDLAEG